MCSEFYSQSGWHLSMLLHSPMVNICNRFHIVAQGLLSLSRLCNFSKKKKKIKARANKQKVTRSLPSQRHSDQAGHTNLTCYSSTSAIYGQMVINLHSIKFQRMLFFPFSLLINFQSFYFLQHNSSLFSFINDTVSYSCLSFVYLFNQGSNFHKKDVKSLTATSAGKLFLGILLHF